MHATMDNTISFLLCGTLGFTLYLRIGCNSWTYSCHGRCELKASPAQEIFKNNREQERDGSHPKPTYQTLVETTRPRLSNGEWIIA